MSSPDILALMLKELQIAGGQLDPCDADAREAWMSACGMALSGIKDHEARMAQLMNFAVILTVTCMDLPSSVALKLIQHRTLDSERAEE